jgi:hypothetical protein
MSHTDFSNISLFPFNVSRLGVIRCSFVVSYSIKLTASAASGWADT